MYGYKGDGTITFYYDDSKMFSDVSMLSSFMAKSISTTDASVLDGLSISDDEREVYELCVKKTLPNVYETMLKIASSSTETFKGDDKVETKEQEGLIREPGTYIALTIHDNGCTNKNVVKLVDDTIETCLQYGILSEFYSISLNADLKKLTQTKFAANLMQLQQRLFQLKKISAVSKKGADISVPEGYEVMFVKK